MLKWFRNKIKSRKSSNKKDVPKLNKEQVWRINPLALGIFISRRVWFFVVFICLARFVHVNWDECVDFKPFTGYNLLFVIFILMLLLPLLTGLKVSALGMGMEATTKSDSSKEIFERITKAAKAEDITEKSLPELVIKLEASRDAHIVASDAN